MHHTPTQNEAIGGNSDTYSGQSKIWLIAAKFNKESRALNGYTAVVRRRKVEKTSRVPLT